MKSLTTRIHSAIALIGFALAFTLITSIVPTQQAAAASVTFNSYYGNLLHGNIDLDADNIVCSLHDASFTPNKDTMQFRSDLTGEVSATGYTSGGKSCPVTITVDTANDRIDVTLTSAVVWSASSITARWMCIADKKGGAASADPLIHCVDFGGNITSTNADFTGTMNTPIRIQN